MLFYVMRISVEWILYFECSLLNKNTVAYSYSDSCYIYLLTFIYHATILILNLFDVTSGSAFIHFCNCWPAYMWKRCKCLCDHFADASLRGLSHHCCTVAFFQLPNIFLLWWLLFLPLWRYWHYCVRWEMWMHL